MKAYRILRALLYLLTSLLIWYKTIKMGYSGFEAFVAAFCLSFIGIETTELFLRGLAK